MDTDGSHNIAVVIGDHHGAALKKVSSTLRKAGFVVVTASSGRTALECCRHERPAVGLAVIDTAAAGIKSLEVEQQLYEVYPNIRMLFLSDDNPETIHEAEPLGHVRRVLRKPYRRSRLLGRVLEMMEQPRALGA
jgi:CheY-like chemotaxis protein